MRCRNHSRATKIGQRMWKRKLLCSNGVPCRSRSRKRISPSSEASIASLCRANDTRATERPTQTPGMAVADEIHLVVAVVCQLWQADDAQRHGPVAVPRLPHLERRLCLGQCRRALEGKSDHGVGSLGAAAAASNGV